MPAKPVTTFLLGLYPPRPWPVLLTGVGITALGLAVMALGEGAAPFRFVAFLVGLVLAGAGVSLRFKTAGQAFEERMETAGVLAVAAFTALLAFLGTDAAWDSMAMVLVVMIVVALVGVVLVLLPIPSRKIAAAVLILAHFGAILTAATAIDPPNSMAPWISRKLSVVYTPYLQFMYLNNAYHFYSPDPGPPSVVWFHIKYQNGKVKWFKIPNRDEDPVQLHHTRLLSVTESTSSFYQQLPWDASIRQAIRASREQAGKEYDIPLDESMYPIDAQYQEALPYSQKMIESYVRHVATTFPSLGDPDNTVKSIKVYRFRQTIIDMKSMAEGADPQDKRLFIGYYEGEYDKEGELLRPDVVDKNDRLLRRTDPFRFWYMPIYYRAGDHALVDYLTKHARLDLDKPGSEQRPDPNDSPWSNAEESKP
jgi:hypothetical protein